jgi:acyl-CoA thioesterase
MSVRDLIGLLPTDDPDTWELPLHPGVMTANGAMYGGAGLAAAVLAMESRADRPLVWATAQYLDFVRMPATLRVEVTVPVERARTTQARATVRDGDREILTVLATLGHRPERFAGTFVEMPDVPHHATTKRQLAAEAAGTFHQIYDMRIVRGVSRRQLARGKPAVETGGRAAFWVCLPGGPGVPDAAELSLIGDLVPSAFATATGQPITGSSLDNTIRMGASTLTEWVLADVQVHALGNGYGHGVAHLWAEDGTLLATASQSAFVRDGLQLPNGENL